jgi:hypothetical protein
MPNPPTGNVDIYRYQTLTDVLRMYPGDVVYTIDDDSFRYWNGCMWRAFGGNAATPIVAHTVADGPFTTQQVSNWTSFSPVFSTQIVLAQRSRVQVTLTAYVDNTTVNGQVLLAASTSGANTIAPGTKPERVLRVGSPGRNSPTSAGTHSLTIVDDYELGTSTVEIMFSADGEADVENLSLTVVTLGGVAEDYVDPTGPAPTVQYCVPSGGYGVHNQVTLYGTGFTPDAVVTWTNGGLSQVPMTTTVVSDTQIDCDAHVGPPAFSYWDATVTTRNGSGTLSGAYEYWGG